MIDTDYAGTMPAFYKELKKNNMTIADILDNGECFVGDLEPIEYLRAYEKNQDLEKDWKMIMSYNPKMIHYAHVNEKYFL